MDLKGSSRHIYLCLILSAFILVAANASSDKDLNAIFSQVETSLKGVQGDTKEVLSALTGLRNDLKSKPSLIDKAKSIMGTVGSAVGKLKSKDAVQIISGCLDIVSGIATTFGGPVGMGIGAVASFVSAIMGLFTGNAGKSSINTVIDTALKKHRDVTLQGQAAGAKRDFAESSAFIQSLKKHTDLTKDDLAILAANVPIYKFSAMLGTLESRIAQGAVTTDFAEAKRTLDFILLYSQLAVMRETMLIDLSLLYRKTGDADHIADAVDSTNKINKQFARDSMSFLHNLVIENALVGALYYPIANSQTSQAIAKYAQYFGVSAPPRTLQTSYYRFESVKWNKWSMCSEAYMNNYMFRGCPNRSRPNMKVVKLDSGHYTIQNSRKRKLYITKHDQGWAWGTLSSDPGPQGHVIFIPLKSGHYLMSTEKWPNWFMYMESSASGYVRSWKGNPGAQGLWRIL